MVYIIIPDHYTINLYKCAGYEVGMFIEKTPWECSNRIQTPTHHTHRAQNRGGLVLGSCFGKNVFVCCCLGGGGGGFLEGLLIYYYLKL